MTRRFTRLDLACLAGLDGCPVTRALYAIVLVVVVVSAVVAVAGLTVGCVG